MAKPMLAFHNDKRIKETKNEFDRQRNQTPYSNSSSTDEFLAYLLKKNKTK